MPTITVQQLALERQMRKLFFKKRLSFNTNKFCFQKILDSTFKLMLSSKVLRMGIQKTQYQNTYELEAGSQEFTVDFKGCDRHFDWLEISLLYDKSDSHLTLYDSYNVECVARMIKSVELSNISDAYSATNLLKYDINNDTQKHLLWKQYVAWHCNGYRTAPISDYINNPVFEELLLENDYFEYKSDEKIYIDLRDSMEYTDEIDTPSRYDTKLTVTIETKSLLAKELRSRVWGYTNGEYLYMLRDSELMLKYKAHTIKALDDVI